MVEVYVRLMLGVSKTTYVIADRCLGALAQTVATISILPSLFHTHTHTHNFHLHKTLKLANFNCITLGPTYAYFLPALWQSAV